LHPGRFSAKLELMSAILTNKERIQEARKALAASKLPPREQFARLVDLGWIDLHGRVTKLLGGTAEPEPSAKARNGR
jgi:hypothetical protein